MKRSILAATALTAFTSVMALPNNEIETFFFDSENRYIGSTLLTCSGNFFRWGETRHFHHKEVLSFSCLGALPDTGVVQECTNVFSDPEEQATCIDIKISQEPKNK